MTPAEKRAAATDKRVIAARLLREAVQLDREAQIEDTEKRRSRTGEKT